MTRERESLHVAALTDGDAAVALVATVIALGVRDVYDDLVVRAHHIDGPGIWSEETDTPEQPSVWKRIEGASWFPAAVAFLLLASITAIVLATATQLLGRA